MFFTIFRKSSVYGIYIEEESMGVRIEDNILITKNGTKVLSKSIPKEIKDIEKLLA